MKDFVAAVALIDKIKDAAEAADHHPDIHLTGFRKLAIELSTHSAGGLTDKDFALAAEIERLPKSLKV
jgi:4a-hydroxytetrahydrobiopterin dehydratase